MGQHPSSNTSQAQNGVVLRFRNTALENGGKRKGKRERKHIDLTFTVPSLKLEWDLGPLKNSDT